MQAKPQIVFEERIPKDRTASRSLFTGTACAAAVAECTQIHVTDGVAVPLKSGKVIYMRAADPSLKKKLRTERMSRLEREYRW
jgi:hypothetical protein